MAVVTVRGQKGAIIKAASGTGNISTPSEYPGGFNQTVNITGLDFVPDLVIVYNMTGYYETTSSRYFGDLVPTWNERGWGNGQPAISDIALITGGFSFKVFVSTSAFAYAYKWRAFKLS